MSGESAAERWSPAQRVESVLISVLSLIDDAEVSSPANVDAGVMLRTNPQRYKDRVKLDLEASKKDIPEGFIMPDQHTAYKREVEEDNAFSWSDSEEEDDFGGSDSDAEMTFDEDEDDDGQDVDTGSSDED